MATSKIGKILDKLCGQNEYSTSEQRIGTWIDGKPLYRKFFNSILTAGPTSQTWFNIIAINGLNIDKIISCKIYSKGNQSDGYAPTYPTLTQKNGNYLEGYFGGSFTWGNCFACMIEYTKTTDTANGGGA